MKFLFLICHLLVIYGPVLTVVRDYVYVSQKMDWTAAQSYCRQNYWDLATINSEEENRNAVMVLEQNTDSTWIGLNRTEPHAPVWQWSDGENVTFTQWAPWQPDDWSRQESCAVILPGGWNDINCQYNFPFICSKKYILVNESKTWEEAHQYCRTYYTDLVFVDPETVLVLLKTESEQAQTASVWTGLRFIYETWLWVNGTLLGSSELLPSCPVEPYRCGAYNFNKYIWENRDCNEELNFFCYYER